MFLNDLKNRLQPHAIPTIFDTGSLISDTALPMNIKPSFSDMNMPISLSQKATAQEIIDEQENAFQLDYNKYITKASTSHAKVQCEKMLSRSTPRKQKLRRALKLSHKKRLLYAKPAALSSAEKLDNFLNLYDQFLTPELATLVKFNAKNKSIKSRFTTEYKQFALNIYFLGPRVYKYLSKFFHCPVLVH
ncbi:hypothetical protein MML48_10g00015253 [Holotrichia oblita]|uniref:Uncharacterized protein n=1 Tax=Holotrichia oblita TaxID=644536 RepID=A0ACB9SGH1_HOLOL|nr:hypothetical protein MML48_10g00015253 [Holotrichia oblita]